MDHARSAFFGSWKVVTTIVENMTNHRVEDLKIK